MGCEYKVASGDKKAIFATGPMQFQGISLVMDSSISHLLLPTRAYIGLVEFYEFFLLWLRLLFTEGLDI